jgi:hypothetical protein
MAAIQTISKPDRGRSSHERPARGASRCGVVKLPIEVVLLFTMACGPAQIVRVTDEVTFSDTSRLSLLAAGTPSDAGVAPDVVLGAGRVSTGDGASTDYVVDVARADAGAPEVHWKTGASLYNGDYLAVPSSNVVSFTEAPFANAGHPWRSDASSFRVEGCTYVSEAYTGGGYLGHMIVPRHHLGYEIRAEIPCAHTGLTVPFVLESPWTNVTIRRTVTHQRHTQGTLAILGGNMMYFGIFPSAVGAATQIPTAEGVGVAIAGTGLLMLLGALIFLPSDSWNETILLQR